MAQPQQEQQQSQQVDESQPSESDQWNQKLCPNGIEEWKALTTMNPFDSKGRCFNYQGGLVQMLDKSKGLFSFVSVESHLPWLISEKIVSQEIIGMVWLLAKELIHIRLSEAT